MTLTLEYTAISALTISAAIIVAIELLRRIMERAIKLAGGGPAVIRDIGVFARILEILLVVFTVARLTGVSSEITALAVSGVGAVAASLALQTTLTNIISGVLLLTDGVIHSGDTIEYSGVKGKIVRISLRTTWIKTDAGSIAVVSNSQLSNGPLINHSALERFRKRYRIE